MSHPEFPTIDFHEFHTRVLPTVLAEGRGALALPGTRGLGSLAFKVEGGAFTYLPTDDGIDVVAGDDRADTVIELDSALFSNVVNELDAAAGLLYGGRARCPKGEAVKWVAWEPALRAMFSGRPIYDPYDGELRDRHGAALDPEQTFTPGSAREDMAHFLRTAGYLLVRGVFECAETERFLAEAEELAGEARKGDKLSWWGKNAAGEEILCRVTRAGARPGLASIPTDPRLLALVELADEPLAHRARATSEEGVSVIWKRPDMTEGLGDIPWHRDCGMGGHAILCPVLIASTYLTPATPESGELQFLPGSWKSGCPPIDARHPRAPRGAHFAAEPGDVTLHYGDTMHAAPPPTRSDLAGYRVSAVTGFSKEGARPHRGKHYNEVLHGREDGQIEHLEVAAKKRDRG